MKESNLHSGCSTRSVVSSSCSKRRLWCTSWAKEKRWARKLSRTTFCLSTLVCRTTRQSSVYRRSTKASSETRLDFCSSCCWPARCEWFLSTLSTTLNKTFRWWTCPWCHDIGFRYPSNTFRLDLCQHWCRFSDNHRRPALHCSLPTEEFDRLLDVFLLSRILSGKSHSQAAHNHCDRIFASFQSVSSVDTRFLCSKSRCQCFVAF